MFIFENITGIKSFNFARKICLIASDVEAKSKRLTELRLFKGDNIN